jgi:hypothetical protein
LTTSRTPPTCSTVEACFRQHRSTLGAHQADPNGPGLSRLPGTGYA